MCVLLYIYNCIELLYDCNYSVEGTLDEMIKLLNKIIASGGKENARVSYEKVLAYAQELQDLRDNTWLQSNVIVGQMLEVLSKHAW